MQGTFRLCAVAGACAIAVAVHAASALRFGAEINVSRTPTPTEKARLVRLAYLDQGTFRKAWLFAYGDGPSGRQNIHVRFSFDEGASWSSPVLLSRDAAGAPTGGQTIVARDSLAFVADNGKPSVFAPPVTAGPRVVVAWNSGYCPQDPGAANGAGSYVNPVQGAGDFDGDGTPDRPFHCVWVATATDPSLATWDVSQLTNGTRDAINEVIGGSATGNAYALAWQEDPAGLQPGEGEGRGDGGMGSHVTGGTNIWYTHAPAPDGATLRTNVAQLSDNAVPGTGQPGASRPNLQLSGTTAVVAYEETACPGGSGGKCIVYHAFPYASHDGTAAGTIVSDVTRNARRARFVLQGASAAGASRLRTVLLWRESPIVAPATPADIVVRRGFVDPVARPGSTGYLPSDILADTPQNMTQVAARGGNANAHRAIVRGSFIALAYDMTPGMEAADPEKTAVPSANYNLFLTRSEQDGDPGSWNAPVNVSRIDSPSLTVVEPRLVPTPGTLVNPLTGTPDAGDAQDADVFYLSFATETNTRVGQAGRVFLSRSTDRGASFEPFVPVSPASGGQSEAQLRPSPDGRSALVLWMAEQTIGDPDSRDAVFASASAVELADLGVDMAAAPFPAGGQRTLTLTVWNRGTGSARDVLLTGTLAPALSAVGISDPPVCQMLVSSFRCALPEIPAGRLRTVSITVGSAAEGSHEIAANVDSEYIDADSADNSVVFTLDVTAPPPPVVPPPPSPAPVPEASGGGALSLAIAGLPFDPTLPLLVAMGLMAPLLRCVPAGNADGRPSRPTFRARPATVRGRGRTDERAARRQRALVTR